MKPQYLVKTSDPQIIDILYHMDPQSYVKKGKYVIMPCVSQKNNYYHLVFNTGWQETKRNKSL